MVGFGGFRAGWSGRAGRVKVKGEACEGAGGLGRGRQGRWDGIVYGFKIDLFFGF